MKWEYQIVYLEGMASDERKFDELGLLEWELVSVSEGYAYFKSPLNDGPDFKRPNRESERS